MIEVRSLSIACALAIAGAAGLAEADMGPPADGGPIGARLELHASLDSRAGHKKSMGRHLTDKLTLWSNELGSHLNLLTVDMIDFHFDVRKRYANVRIGGLSDGTGVQVDGDIKVRHNVARIRSKLALGVRGQTLRFELPVFEVTSQDVGGQRSVELRLPIIEGTF